jgi:hypothetical protein
MSLTSSATRARVTARRSAEREAARILGALVFAAAGCSSTADPSASLDAGTADGSIRADDEPARAALVTATRLASVDRELSSRLAPNLGAWGLEPRGARWISPGRRSGRMGDRYEVGARLPVRADGVIEIGIGDSAAHTLTLAPEGAGASEASEDAGRVSYSGAFRATDVVWTASAQRVEWFFVLADASAPTTFSFLATLPSELPTVRAEPNGGLSFLDRGGTARLRMPRPFAVDARGTRRDAELTFASGRLVVHVDTRGLAMPVLLDPALETTLWEQRAPATSPAPRYAHGLAFDRARGRTLLFAGAFSSGGFNAADTWEWDGTNWTQRSPATSPSKRYGHAFAYDVGRARAVLFSGSNGLSDISDTWEWDGTNWAQRSPATSPPARTGGVLVYDSVRAKTVLFGGYSISTATNQSDTWEWDGTTWTQRTPSKSPSGRVAAAGAFDSARGRLVLFGGETGLGTFGDTWEWDGTTWTLRTPAASPSPRSDHSLAFDEARGRIVLFGGTSGETWEYDGTTWLNRTPPAGPSSRADQGLAFDRVRGMTVLFGGFGTASLGDTWEYHARGGPCTAGSQCDSGFCTDGVCCERAACPGVCQACNTAASPGVCAAVLNATDPDTCTGANACGPSGLCSSVVGRSCSSASECTTGFCSDGVCCDTACAGVCDVCAAALGATSDGTCSTPAGYPGNPSCGAYACTGASVACTGTSCASDANCGPGYYCAPGGVCLARKAQGAACNSAAGADCLVASCRACVTGNCVDGVCCGSAACAAGLRCDVPGKQGSCSKPNAAACTSASECGSGFCVDGVCCESACGAQCAACDVAGHVGACVAIAPADAPHGSRSACPGSGTCRAVCDGVAMDTCVFPGAATPCAAATCRDSTHALGAAGCDGKGACTTPAVSDCGSYACDSTLATCKTGCSAPGDCALGFVCTAGACQKGAIGTACTAAGDCNSGNCVDGVCCNTSSCAPPLVCNAAGNPGTCSKPLGTGCAASNECGSGFCTDGVCCDALCTGKCEACDLTGKVGTCSTVTGAPHGARGACAGTGVCSGKCDGTVRGGCTFPTSECSSPSCSGAAFTPTATCDGNGSCKPVSATSCVPYACGATGCKTACAVAADCASGFRCNAGTCEQSPTCNADFTASVSPAGVSTPCGDYACNASNGLCVSFCLAVSDCAAGLECTSTGACARPAGSSQSSGGCGVAKPTQSDEGASGPLLGIGLALALSLRLAARRGRAPRRAP